jgi:signal transduction histidine kinase
MISLNRIKTIVIAFLTVNPMISLNRITNIVIAFLAMVFFFLIWQGYANYRGVEAYHQVMAERTVTATANEISILIRSYRRMLELFASQHEEALLKLMQNPSERELADSLAESLRMFLPEYTDYVLADADGRLLFSHQSNSPGVSCRVELLAFARSGLQQQPVKIHTDEQGSHFDIVVDLGKGEQTGMFLVSFMLERLQDILRHGQSSGHHMLLLRSDQPERLALALDQTSRKYSLPGMDSEAFDEMIKLLKPGISEQILASKPIDGTHWLIADLPDRDLYVRAWQGIVVEYALIFITFAGITTTMLLLTRREGVRTGETTLTIEGIEAERRRIAMDLHDQVLGEITHIGRGLDELNKSCAAGADSETGYLELREGLNLIGDSIRTVIDDLHPQALSILGLEVAFRAMLEKRTFNLDKPAWSLEVEEGVDSQLSKQDRLSLYRIMLEVSHNVVKHARADFFSVTIALSEPGKLEVAIEDDGIGFSPKQTGRTNSLGMANILTRARMMNAAVAWATPATGKGTRFELIRELRA